MAVRLKRPPSRRRPRRTSCRPCTDTARFVTDIVDALGADWREHCAEDAGWFTANHRDGRRVVFYPPHNTHSRIVTAYFEVPGEFRYVAEGVPLQLPLDVNPAAAAEAVVRMPLEPQPRAGEPGRRVPAPKQMSVRAQLGRLRVVLQKLGATVGEVQPHSDHTGWVKAVGEFGDAVIVVDSDGLVRMTIHNMPNACAEAALAALGGGASN